MKLFLLTLFLFMGFLSAQTIPVTDTLDYQEILSNSKIYKDPTQSLTIDTIQQKDLEFKENDKTILSFGYAPDFDVWIKFTLENSSNHSVTKILEYANSMTTHIDFFDLSEARSLKDGIFQKKAQRKTLNPYFKIILAPYETKTFYVKAISDITTLIIELNLWNTESFFSDDTQNQAILMLFFGAMLILIIYNFFIYLFSKDISYLYYTFYILGLGIHQLSYRGIAAVYLLSQDQTIVFIEMSFILITFPILMLALFIKSFLKITIYTKINFILNIFILFILFNTFITIFSDYKLILVFFVLYLVFVIIFSVYKKNRQAYFILFGWILVSTALILMYLNGTGAYNISERFPFIFELLFTIEALLFSIALAYKINQLKNEKNNADQKLIQHEKVQKEELKIQVQNKTKELNDSLEIQKTLLQELNHRVKNNMQTILSLVRFQADQIDDKNIKEILMTVQNRINATSELHELLYKETNISQINTYEYFEALINGLQNNYENEFDITYDINVNLNIEDSISCGIILNELVTNSFKYAFNDQYDGQISISLTKENDDCIFNISDNGSGYKKESISKLSGLVLVETLVEDALKGTLNTKSKNNGVFNQIKWKQNE